MVCLLTQIASSVAERIENSLLPPATPTPTSTRKLLITTTVSQHPIQNGVHTETHAKEHHTAFNCSQVIAVQALSDLHLEIGQQYLSYSFPATAPFLLFTGDIGRLADYDGYLISFLQVQVARYQKVFLVLGNHEFFGLDYESALEKAQHLAQESSLSDKVVLLHKSYWDDPQSDARILGCTLWSAVPTDAYEVVESKVNDFRKIHEWSVQRHNEVHAQEAAWLRAQVKANSNRQLLVATHHAPCIEGNSRPEQTSHPWTPAFATNLIDGEWEAVKVWAFGHTHYSTDFVRCGIRVIANQEDMFSQGVQTRTGKENRNGALSASIQECP